MSPTTWRRSVTASLLACALVLLAAPAASAHAPLLRQGDRGQAVSAWQSDLNRVAAAGLRVDGVFGPLTDRATRRFQAGAGLVADGVVGPSTRRAAGATSGTALVQVFFSDRLADRSDCTPVAPVPRRVPAPAVLRGALVELLEGPTAAEEQVLGPGVLGPETAGLLRAVRLEGGVATVDFSARMLEMGALGTACGSAALVAQLEATTRQFPTVDRAVFSIGGQPCRFQELIGTGSC